MKPRPAEWLLAGYSVVVIGVGLARTDRFPAAGWAVGAHALVILLVGLLQLPQLGRFGRSVRQVAPILLLLALYGALDLLNGFGAVTTLDPTIQRWEAAIFGGQPSLTWRQGAPSVWWSTIFHAAYFSYYLIVPFPIALFLHRGDAGRLQRAMLVVLLSFVGCYLAFLAFPVAGPYYQFARPPEWFVGNPPAQAVYWILSGGSSYGAAFPSSHVAATWAAVAATASGAPRWATALGLGATLLTLGAVYCQMHYAIDVIAGLGVAAIATVIGYRIARDS